MNVLTDLKNRGVADVFFIVCDGLKGLPDSVTAVFPRRDRPDLHRAPDPGHLPVRLQAVLGGHRQGPATDLHRAQRDAAWAAFEEFEEKWGKAYPAIPKLWRNSLGAVHPVPGLRRRDPQGALLDQRDRALNARYRRAVERQGPLPHRTGRAEDAVPGHPIPGPQRARAGTMGHPVEAGPERLRRHLRRPHAGSGEPLTMETPVTPLIGQTPPGPRPLQGPARYIQGCRRAAAG